MSIVLELPASHDQDLQSSATPVHFCATSWHQVVPLHHHSHVASAFLKLPVAQLVALSAAFQQLPLRLLHVSSFSVLLTASDSLCTFEDEGATWTAAFVLVIKLQLDGARFEN